MPYLHDVTVTLGMEEVLRREGIREYSKLRLEMIALIGELLASVDALHLLEPAVAYEFYTITGVGHYQLSLEGNAVVHDGLFSSILPKAKELAAVVCTIGPKLEERVTDYFDRGKPLRGLLLDGIGNAAIDSLTQEVCRFMGREASLRAYQASSPVNPGMPGFPISKQWQVFKLVPAEESGVRLTRLGIMVPRKSASMVIGMGSQMTTWTQDEVCARCSLKKTCHYRVPAQTAKQNLDGGKYESLHH